MEGRFYDFLDFFQHILKMKWKFIIGLWNGYLKNATYPYFKWDYMADF